MWSTRNSPIRWRPFTGIKCLEQETMLQRRQTEAEIKAALEGKSAPKWNAA